MIDRIHTARERSWPERVLYLLVGLVILTLGFFFLTVALVAGALLALAIAARWWWLTRKLRRDARADVLEGEYEIVERRRNASDDAHRR